MQRLTDLCQYEPFTHPTEGIKFVPGGQGSFGPLVSSGGAGVSVAAAALSCFD